MRMSIRKKEITVEEKYVSISERKLEEEAKQKRYVSIAPRSYVFGTDCGPSSNLLVPRKHVTVSRLERLRYRVQRMTFLVVAVV